MNDRSPALVRGLRLLFWIVPAAFYAATCCRTPAWLDATMIASNAVELALGSWVNTHNLFHLVGHLWLKLLAPVDTHFALVLLCALFGSITVHFVLLTGLELAERPLSAVIGSLALMISHSLWWHSTTIEVYTMNTALMAAFLYLVIRFDRTRRARCLLLAAFAFGLGCSNHVLMGLFISAFAALFVVLAIQDSRVSAKLLAAAALCFALGFSLYLFVFVRDVARNARAFSAARPAAAAVWKGFVETVDGATGSYFRKHMFTPGMPRETRLFWRVNYLVLHALNYPSPALPLAWFGLLVFWRKRQLRLSAVFFTTGIVAQAVWSSNYFIWDMFAFALPVFVLLAVPLILAIDWLAVGGRIRRAVLLACLPAFLLPLLVYPMIPVWYREGGIVRRYFDTYPEVAWTRGTFDAVEFVARPERSRYDKVERYVRRLFAILPHGAHLLNSDGRADYPLRYYYRDIKGERTDITYHPVFIPTLDDAQAARIASGLRQRLQAGEPVYAASVEYPEKAVLDQLYRLYDPSKTAAALRTLDGEEYLRSFPGVHFEKIVMFPQEEVWIYRLEPRTPQAAGGAPPPPEGNMH